MNQQIYINLPVRDLPRSKAFFSALGYSFNPQFTDEKAACMVISEDIYVMLLTEPFCQTFTHKPLADARKSTEVLLCLSCKSRDEVDA
ncbi:MAG: glyoxalase/bleomycin resistance/extradiol dioxygenase family protein, partial [Burkholderiales bacterium]|nr:glyoxalase/bleomycin resistance/extradiol dioxygenase family protein [Burkholderiales bacterium]